MAPVSPAPLIGFKYVMLLKYLEKRTLNWFGDPLGPGVADGARVRDDADDTERETVAEDDARAETGAEALGMTVSVGHRVIVPQGL